MVDQKKNVRQTWKRPLSNSWIASFLRVPRIALSLTPRLMDELISFQVTLLRRRSRSTMTGREGDNKIKYMTEEEESAGEKVVGV